MPARPTSRDCSPMPNRQSERTQTEPPIKAPQRSRSSRKLQTILIELLNVCIGQGGFDGESDYDLRMRRLTKRFCMRRPSLETSRTLGRMTSKLNHQSKCYSDLICAERQEYKLQIRKAECTQWSAGEGGDASPPG